MEPHWGLRNGNQGCGGPNADWICQQIARNVIRGMLVKFRQFAMLRKIIMHLCEYVCVCVIRGGMINKAIYAYNASW